MDIILTNMCMLIDKKTGKILVENRSKNDWPGLTFPGGHVEEDESLEEAVIREMFEETGLRINNPKLANAIEWIINGVRHLSILYNCDSYSGELHSSWEGEVFWILPEEIKNYELSNDFEIIYNKIKPSQE
ncbi:MAG: NUDIX domain-containing protein [Bacilli bacterium]